MTIHLDRFALKRVAALLGVASLAVVRPGVPPAARVSVSLAAPVLAQQLAATPIRRVAPGNWDEQGIAPPQVDYPTWEYDGRFTFVRLRFRPSQWRFDNYAWGLDLKWNHDYPEAEENLTRILEEITLIRPRTIGGNILEVGDPELFRHPWAYLCEPGFWQPTVEEIAQLREYLLRGGFLMIDDMYEQTGRPDQWDNTERQMRRMFPAATLYPLDISHPVFRAFFELEDLDIQDPEVARFGYSGKIYGLFEDNDPAKRLMVVVNYAMDIGDYWEWSDRANFYPKHMTEKGFKVGINYVVYGMLH